VVADSCYSGRLTRGVLLSAGPRTLTHFERLAAKKARVVLTAGGLEPVADTGGAGKHSVFASALIRVLKSNEGMLDGCGLFEDLRRAVMVNSDQTPEYSDIQKAGHDGGDFIFVRRRREEGIPPHTGSGGVRRTAVPQSPE
jgi:hypothetical protein